ncbi:MULTISPECIES: hypothetical protein [unclassified Pseudomonas]|uniref:hypothetical protein n=1 Tax=unclassified Pseudomonas TaxID=196821 RepID=UPI0035BF7D64
MKITMFLEIEEGASLEMVGEILAGRASSFEVKNTSVEGVFPELTGTFNFDRLESICDLTAENWEVSWSVGVIGVFDCRASGIERMWDEIKFFMETFASRCQSRFVLSFQFESVYAFREQSGVVYEKSMVI